MIENAASYARLYDSLYADKPYDREAAIVLSLVEAAAPAPFPVRSLLDVGCGTGRHALAFRQHGIAVTGVDIDADMIAQARRNAARPGAADSEWPDPIFLVGGPNAAPAGPFDLAVSLFNVVNYFRDIRGLLGLFEAVHARLPAGRWFVFDAWNGIAALRDPPREKEHRTMVDGRTLVARTRPRLDVMAQECRLEVAIESDGEAIVHHAFQHRLWTPRDLTDLCAAAGFGDAWVTTWAAPQRPATAEDWKILIGVRRL